MALKDYVSGKLLATVQSLYGDGWARVRVGRRELTRFQVKSGAVLFPHGSLTSYRQDSNSSKEEILWQCAAIYRAVRGAVVCR